MTESIRIDKRYNGPPDSGNGGFTAGSIAALYAGPPATATAVVVTLRVPPPLDTALTVVREAGNIRVYGPDAALVADAAPATLDVAPVPPVSYADAEAAEVDYPGFVADPFPTCFVCGPARMAGDGMRLFPGRLVDGRTASAWIVPDDISVAMVWAALDCPGGWSIGIEARPYVLGRITARVYGVPAPGDRCVVMGRMISSEGRKAMVASTLYGPHGEELARAQGTWLAIV